MSGNRKRTETYRFNGSPFLHEGSIHSVEIAELEDRIKTIQAKLDDPSDLDDAKWTKRWLDRFQKELHKKIVYPRRFCSVARSLSFHRAKGIPEQRKPSGFESCWLDQQIVRFLATQQAASPNHTASEIDIEIWDKLC